MVALKHILREIPIVGITGSPTVRIRQIAFDSRKVEVDDCFVALSGSKIDGHRFIDKAIAEGAIAVVCEILPVILRKGITYIQVNDSAEALGAIAANYYGHPSHQLPVIGVTGTNGKTTVATLLYQLFTDLGYKTGLISTVENKIGQEVIPAKFTTPDALTLQSLLAEMVAAGCSYVFMEVSSHAIHQRRISKLHFSGGIFTNISHDHLDYHKTFKEYITVKKRFFDELPKTAFALTNIDDKNGSVMVQNTRAAIHRYSLRTLTDFKAKIIENSLTGLHLEINGQAFFGKLIGEFNAYNLLAVYATAILLDQDQLEVLTQLSQLQSVNGRFDHAIDPKRKIIGIVDYAHTPDALDKVLSTINQLKPKGQQLLTVVGCGGDRDREKRPIMAQFACRYSDQVILTSDNPRTEDPESIIREMEAGIPKKDLSKTLLITDRLQAIRTACRLAKTGDIILVAGKGHETYQDINGIKHPFDDKKILKESLETS
ncbi:MAG: UDP-N-acetylmuramoyl-L-alanyl-D-glutamate--2,6-diaminopimelate ligase [Bacteroidota bacterium]